MEQTSITLPPGIRFEDLPDPTLQVIPPGTEWIRLGREIIRVGADAVGMHAGVVRGAIGDTGRAPPAPPPPAPWLRAVWS